jgi:hypothetical protein
MNDENIDDVEVKRFSFVNKVFKAEFDKKPFDIEPKLKRFVTMGYYRVRTNRDLFIACSGKEGEGKSNTVNLLGYLMDANYDLEKNVLYTPNAKEMTEKISYRKYLAKNETPPDTSLPPYSFINIDEAIRILFKLEQWSGIQRFLKKLFALARSENKIIGFCIPDFLDMGSGFRARMDYWINMETRGMASVESRSLNKYKTDKWNLDDNNKSYESYTGRKKYCDITPEMNVTIQSRISKNFMTSFHVPKLPDVLDKRYNELKETHDFNETAKDDNDGDKVSTRTKRYYDGLVLLMNKMVTEYKYTQVQLGEITKIPSNTVSQMLTRNKKVNLSE